MSMPLRVRDYMSGDVVTVDPDLGIMQLVQLLVERDISGVIVVDPEGHLVGIVTERDCIGVALQAGYFDELAGTAAELMTTEVETVGADESLVDVAARMVESPHRRFPVVEDGRIVGLLSRRDVLRALECGSWFAEADHAR